MSYTVTYQVDDSNPSGYNIVASDKDAYNYASVTSGGYSNSASVPYASDIVLDFLTNKGTYIKTITIGYLESSEYKTVVVSFVWDNSGKVSYSVRGGTSVNNRETTNTYVQILNSTQYVANGIYLKVLDYNRDGTNKSNAVVDASRVIVAFDGIKTNMSVSIEVDDQTFEVKYYRYIKGKTGTPDSSDYLNTMQYKYGTVVDDAFLNSYTYTPSYSFSGYYYGSLSGGNITDPSNSPSSKLTKGTKITKNIILVGLYVYAERQAVSFYYFDTTTENYVTLEEVNRKYIVRYQSGGRDVKGEYADVNFDSDARLKTWPSPSQMQWPVGTYLVGYVIADSAPSGDYYSFTKGNTSGLSVLDGSVKVDRDLKAYAVYNTTKFNLRMRKSGGALQAMADYQLYDTAPDGSVRELDPSEIYLVKLTSSQKSIFDSVLRNTSQDVASALGAALNWDLSGIIPFSSRDYEDIGEVSGTAYFFLVTVAYSSDGRAYITQVSSNGYSYLSGRLSYFAT